MSRAIVALWLAVLTGSGCAFSAKRPPSPATALDVAELSALPTPPGERYYLIVFSSQSVPKQAKYTHTWATLVRAVGDCNPVLDIHTISWMPKTLDIHPWRFKTEPGVNLTLEQSLKCAVDTNQRISMWGPYEVRHGFSVRFRTQENFLNSGAIGYQCTDSLGESARTGNGSDCIHAVTDMDPIYSRSRYPLLYFGDSASNHLVKRIMQYPMVIEPRKTHDWLIPRLGLDRYEIVHREHRGRVEPYVPDSPPPAR